MDIEDDFEEPDYVTWISLKIMTRPNNDFKKELKVKKKVSLLCGIC